MPWPDDRERQAKPKLDERLFKNTQHPATHNPKWRDLGPRGKRKVRHRSCDRCASYVEYRTAQGAWVKETGRCWHDR
jgi:hypothetical protein